MLSVEELAKTIDHTNLKPFADESSIKKTILEAKEYNFRGVCIPPYYVSLARKLLDDTDIKVVTVIGFPLGFSTTESKIFEAKIAEDFGADEIDMVINISQLKSGNFDFVKKEIASIVNIVSIPVKVIIETSYLETNQIAMASRIVEEAGAHCVKTNTGFGARGVTIDDVKIIRENVSEKMLIKASGGIRTADFAIKLLNAGANILGTSSGVKIIEEYKQKYRKS